MREMTHSTTPGLTPAHAAARRSLIRAVAAVALLFSVLPQRALAHSGFPRATCVAIDQDGRALTSDDFGRLIAWDISNPNLPQLPHVVFDQKHVVGEKTYKAAYVATHGNRALTAGYDGNVLIHDLNDPHKTFPPFTGHQSKDGLREVWVAVFSPDGTQALSGANDGQILLWDVSDPQKPPREFHYPAKLNSEGPVAGLAFLPPDDKGNQRFLSTSGYGDVYLWVLDGKKEDVVKTFSHGNSRQVNAVVLLDDGATFLSGSFDKKLRMWNVNAPGELPKATFQFQQEHKDWIWRVALSPDSNFAATASEDGTVRVWDMGTKKARENLVFQAGKNGSMGVAFTKNGWLVFTLDGSQPQKLIQVVKPNL